MTQVSDKDLIRHCAYLSEILLNFTFSYLKRDFIAGIFRKKCGFHDRREVLEAVAYSQKLDKRRLRELIKFRDVWFGELLDRKNRKLFEAPDLPYPDEFAVYDDVPDKAGVSELQLKFFIYVTHCVFHLATAAEPLHFDRQLFCLRTYLSAAVLGERDFQKLQFEEMVELADAKVRSKEEIINISRIIQEALPILDGTHTGSGISVNEACALLRHELTLDELLAKHDLTLEELKKLGGDPDEEQNGEFLANADEDEDPDDDEPDDKEPSLGDTLTVEELRESLKGATVRLQEIRMPYEDPLYAEASEAVNAHCYTGYVNVFKNFGNTLYNFYPLIEWKDGKPRHLGEYAQRKLRFPEFANVVLPSEIVTGLRLTASSFINVYCDSFSDSEPGIKTRLTVTRHDLNETLDDPIAAAAADPAHRVCVVFELDKTKNERVNFTDVTWLALNGMTALPDTLAGLGNVDAVIRRGTRHYGPYRVNMNAQRQPYVDMRRDPFGKRGLLRELLIKKGMSAEAKYSVEVYCESDRSTYNINVLKVTPDCCDTLLCDQYDTAELLTLLTVAAERKYDEQSLVKEFNSSALATEYPEINEYRKLKLCNYLKDEALKDQMNDRAGLYIATLLPYLIKRSPKDFRTVYDKLVNDPKALAKMEEHGPLQEHLKLLREDLKKLQDRKQKQDEKLSSVQKQVESEEQRLKDVESEVKIRTRELEKQYSTEIAERTAELQSLNAQIEQARTERERLSDGFSHFNEEISDTVNQVSHLAFDGVITKKILQAAETCNRDEEADLSVRRTEAIASLKLQSFKNSRALIDELVRRMQSVRRYSRNDCLNILISLSQNFITILSGAPGIGKTSLCGILGRILGLTALDSRLPAGLYSQREYANRFLTVSVEKGWTSKRDLIGYYNPLTSKFESPDPHRYECFRTLDAEYARGMASLPYLVLLDEANLSPMEYYFADFMNICDERGTGSFITLGNGMRLHIPDTLRFLATINSDHTVETLSPRMVDRAGIIELPEVDDWTEDPVTIAADAYAPISWSDFKQAFAPQKTDEGNQEKLKAVLSDLEGLGLRISSRSKRAMNAYMRTASLLMSAEEGRDATAVSIDYAVLQRVLPHLSGSGEEYRAMLQKLQECLVAHGLPSSAAKVKAILAEGERNMDFFQFFG